MPPKSASRANHPNRGRRVVRARAAVDTARRSPSSAEETQFLFAAEASGARFKRSHGTSVAGRAKSPIAPIAAFWDRSALVPQMGHIEGEEQTSILLLLSPYVYE